MQNEARKLKLLFCVKKVREKNVNADCHMLLSNFYQNGKKQKAVKLHHTEQKMCKKNEYFLKKSDIGVESITC